MSRVDELKQRLAAIKDFGENNTNKHFTAPINKKNELGKKLRRRRIEETQPHIGGGQAYERKDKVIGRDPPYMSHHNTLPFERTKPGTMEDHPYKENAVREKDRKPGTLFDNEEGLQDREFAADSFDDPSMKDPDKWSGEDLKKLEEELTPPSLTNYTSEQPLRDKFHQLNPASVTMIEPKRDVSMKKSEEEWNYIEDPNYKIKPIKPTRMEWRAIISAKLKQRLSRLQQ